MNDWRILRILIIGEVSGCAEKIEFAHMGSVDLRVSLLVEFSGDKFFQFLPDDCPLGFPKN